VHVLPVRALQGFGRSKRVSPARGALCPDQRDGRFFSCRPRGGSAFTWDKLKGKRVLVDHGGQPMAMFKYALHKRGLDFASIQAVNVPSDQMDGAFRKGRGDYIHQQDPRPAVEHDRAGQSWLGRTRPSGRGGLSSLAATRAWLGTDAARRHCAPTARRAPAAATPRRRSPKARSSFFPEIDPAVLAATIGYYQKARCWTPTSRSPGRVRGRARTCSTMPGSSQARR